MRNPFTTAAAAAAAVADGATVAIAGAGGGLVEPDVLLEALERRFLDTGHPRDLTVIHALGIGARGTRGITRLAHEGMVERVIGGHWTWSPAMQALAAAEKIEAFTLPAGAIMLLYREIGSHRPGLVTHVGLGTFADPRHGGGAVNERARKAPPIVERVRFDGRDWLRYLPFPVDVGIIRGSEADDVGNVSTSREAADIDVKGVALAAHNSGGRVLCQVQRRVRRGAMPARLMNLPGILIDHVVLAPDQPQTHAGPGYDTALSGERDTADEALVAGLEPASGLRRIIASRAADELGPGASVNFGFGIPGAIPGILARRGVLRDLWISVEQGMHNGRPLDGDLFGAAADPDAIISSLDQFDFYSGGGIDVACLGMAELDADGNVNVSRLGGNVIGPGGFVDITQNAKEVVLCGAFETKGLVCRATGDGLVIDAPGSVQKLVPRVAEVSFSGAVARARGQTVLYVTERAVFRLRAEAPHVELVEVAPGVDLERDVLARMGFRPHIEGPPRPMARCHFVVD